MGIGKTLTAIVVAGGIGVGGYFIGKGADDKEYGIKREESAVYLLDKTSGKTLELQKFGEELIVGSRPDILKMYDNATMKFVMDTYQSQKNATIDAKIDAKTGKQ